MAFWSIFVDPLTKIAEELIDTPLEKAQAQVLKLKVLDPNGKLRRGISKSTNIMFMSYMGVMSVLLLTQAYGLGNADGTAEAIASLKELFVPIVGAWTAIVMAAFGVNAVNASKGQ